MGFVSRLTTRLFDASDDEPNAREFRCWKCDTTFTSDANGPADTKCPSCGNAEAPWISLAGD